MHDEKILIGGLINSTTLVLFGFVERTLTIAKRPLKIFLDLEFYYSIFP